MNKIFEIAKKFNLPSEPVEFNECTIGHINSTYFVDCENGDKYVLQNINTNIFKNPDILMNNIVGVTAHIRKKLEALAAPVAIKFVRNAGYMLEATV